MKLTQGLKPGTGYTGNYGPDYGGDGPNPGGTYMIPDTATKWVLDYQYRIDTTTANSPVALIRGVLTKAKWRWQELDVVSSISVSGNTVTINLAEPLHKGLQWDLYYPAGAFTDMAGNSAPAITDGNYWFWSSGVQTPVIRVNRRSFDARAVGTGPTNLRDPNTRTYNVPGNTGDTATWNATTAVTDLNGWGIGDFNTVHYRIESETPGATIYSGTRAGNSWSAAGGYGSVTAAWTGSVATNNSTAINARNWNAALGTAVNGQWVLANLIRREGTGGALNYTVTEYENAVRRDFEGTFGLLRSYNRDAQKAELDSLINTAGTALTNGYQGVMTFSNLQASKNYVAAAARINHGGANTNFVNDNTSYGYEGIFRTVVALLRPNQSAPTNNSYPNLVEGSNVKNGMPSVAGFPVRDAEETGDNRFIKLFYHTTATSREYYWVSTEIVCEWYFIKHGGNNNNNNGSATHQSVGEVNNYLTVGYGDLTYGIGIRGYND
jgi:hypothetical protein